MSASRLPLAIAIAFSFVSFLAVASPASAAPGAPGGHVAVDRAVIAIQTCGEVRAFCRGRFGAGPDFRACVRRRACPVVRRLSYCGRVRRFCAAHFPIGTRPFRRCVFREGC